MGINAPNCVLKERFPLFCEAVATQSTELLIFVALDQEGEMNWLSSEEIPIIGEDGFPDDVHVFVSMRDVYMEAKNIPTANGLGLGRIIKDVVGKKYPAGQRNSWPKVVPDSSGRDKTIAPDRFEYYDKKRRSGTLKTEFRDSHDACNDAAGTLFSLVGSVLFASGAEWEDSPLSFPVPWRLIALDCEGSGDGHTRQLGFAQLRSGDLRRDKGCRTFIDWMRKVRGRS